MKKTICLLMLVLLMSLTACGEKTEDLSGVYESIVELTEGYTSDSISYDVVLSSEEMNLNLHNTGLLVNNDGTCTYTYSYQYLNKIGSGAESLISTETGSISGTKEEIASEGVEIYDGVKAVALDLANSFKTHNVAKTEDGYVMTGYIARNTIIKNTDNLDNDIRFNYELTVNSEISELEKLVVSYVTEKFDSVVITITFGEE